MKKIFALLLMLAILCACNMPEKPAVSSESEPRASASESSENKPEFSASESSESETETSQEPEKTWLDDDDPLYYEMKAKDIYESGKHGLYISRVEQRIQSYRDGTFTEMENHHAPYPDDFPDPKNLPEATEENTFLCWRNNNSRTIGCADYVYIIDESHMVILEPVALELMDGTIAYTFADTEYINADVKEWFETKYDGIYENYQ